MDLTVVLPALAQLRQSLMDWIASRRARSAAEQAAIAVLLDALTKTQVYLGDLDMRSASGTQGDPETDRVMERELARVWADAAAAFMGINQEVAPLLRLKSEAWARPMLWNDDRIREAGITIEDISNLAQRLLAGD